MKKGKDHHVNNIENSYLHGLLHAFSGSRKIPISERAFHIKPMSRGECQRM